MNNIILYSLCPIVLYVIRKYREYTWGYYTEKNDLSSKVYIVTGASSGIGKETVRELLSRNATVIMASRDLDTTKKVAEKLKNSVTTGIIYCMELDLTSLDSVRKFSSEVLEKFDKIHCLINNAGVSYPYFATTKDGFEMNMGVNHLGHFMLTNLLVERLKESSPSRIVIVSSSLHEKASINFDILTDPKVENFPKNSRMGFYPASKLANVYFARELSHKLDKTGVQVSSLCPGFCYTKLFRNSSIRWYQYIVFLPIAFFFMRSARQGSQTVVYCAATEKIKESKYGLYKNCKEYKSSHHFQEDVQKKLWTVSEKLVGLQK